MGQHRQVSYVDARDARGVHHGVQPPKVLTIASGGVNRSLTAAVYKRTLGDGGPHGSDREDYLPGG